MYYVHYCRLESCVTDMRMFGSLEELGKWFEAQNKIEPTIIIKILKKRKP